MLFIRNLSYETEPHTLENLFPEATDVYLPKDRDTGERRGFGFITFEDVSTAKQVMKKNDGMDVDGEYISLRFAEERGRGGGRGGGSPGFGRGRGRGGRGGRGNDVINASSIDPTCSIVAERGS